MIVAALFGGMLMAAGGLSMPDEDIAEYVAMARAFLVFLAAIPLTNAVFDFFSVGLTRHLLMWAQREETPPLVRVGLSALDLVLAALCMLGLVFAVGFVLETLNLFAQHGNLGEPLMALEPIHARIQDRPGDPANYWIYFTLLSTFIPTLIHAVAAGIAIAAGIGLLFFTPKDATWLREGYESQGDLSPLAFRLTLSGVLGVAIGLVAMVVIIGGVVWGFEHTIGLVQLSESGMHAAHAVMTGPAESLGDWWVDVFGQ